MMKRVLAAGLIVALLCGIVPSAAEAWGERLRTAEVLEVNGAVHEYIYLPMYAQLIDLDDLPGQGSLYELVLRMFTMDLGFTYLKGPEIPKDWLDSPEMFAAVMNQMMRVDVAAHTQGVNILYYENEVFELDGGDVPSIAFPPQFPSGPDQEENLHQMRLGGMFWFGVSYAHFDWIPDTNILDWIMLGKAWEAMYGSPALPPRIEVVYHSNHSPYKVATYEPLTDFSGDVMRALVRELIMEIVNNSWEYKHLVIDLRFETRHGPATPPYPSGEDPVDFWSSTINRFHRCNLRLERDRMLARLFEPQLSNFPVRDPGTEICPDEQYAWFLPAILPALQGAFTNDNGERCFDVDAIVEVDSGQWWSPFGYQFVEVLNPDAPPPGDFANQEANARAWTFLHVALNNGHRLIDTMNPLDGETEVISIIDVEPFNLETYPQTFEGGPKIHGYHKRQVSPTISEFYKRFHYIIEAPSEAERTQREDDFRNNLSSIISDVHIYVQHPDYPLLKREISVPELLQMIADRWSSENVFSLFPFAFFWVDMPEIDRGGLDPLVFEIACTFDTNPALGGPYVPIRIIAQAHEGTYTTNEYGDIFYALTSGLLGGVLP